ncbi:MAG: hypothetical protein AAFQ14_09960 [Cyanobacteria bacterium J06621_12]
MSDTVNYTVISSETLFITVSNLSWLQSLIQESDRIPPIFHPFKNSRLNPTFPDCPTHIHATNM